MQKRKQQQNLPLLPPPIKSSLSPTKMAATTPSNPSKQIKKIKYILIAMAAIFTLALISLILFFTLTPSSSGSRKHGHHPSPSPPNPSASSITTNLAIITSACKASRSPSTCQSSISHSPTPITNLSQVIQSALNVSANNLNSSISMIQSILDDTSSVVNQNRTNTAKICLEVLHYSEYRLGLIANEALPRGAEGVKDARAWMSAALGYQYDCWSGLKYVNDTSLVVKTMAFLNDTLLASSGDALGMMVNYDVFGEKTESWGVVKTERDGFFEPSDAGSGSGVLGGVPSDLKEDVTVCKDGCNYGTVQKAVDAAPDNGEKGKRFVIRIKAGVYEETVRVPLEKKNVVFLGDGMGKTVITGSMNVGQPGVTTYNTATVGVMGDGFMARDLTIQNTAGPDAHQAVAFRSDSDLSIIENCELIGNQDTLYAHSLRQYYKSCRIQGNVDFIFGNSASFFQDCVILVAPRQLNPEKGENNAVTAHGRIDPAQSTGFVFQNCVINGTDAYMALYKANPKVHKNYLGRPWKEYSRTVFIRCTLEALIEAEGWMPWSGDFALKTLYYGEFENKGLGSDTSKRVNWSSLISAEHASAYSVQDFIQGDKWIPTSS